jgi:methionine-gamma-lyase
MSENPKAAFGTRAVHAGESPDPSSGALDPPVVLSTAFAFEDAEQARARFANEAPGPIYSRWANPTVSAFEEKMAALEGAEAAVALGSGMAAVAAAITTGLRAGDRVILAQEVYAETARLLERSLSRFGVQTERISLLSLSALEVALARGPARIVYAETPANPDLRLTDVRAVAERAHQAGAILVVDSTFATPYHQRPIELGADRVVHSATKSICGHGDALGGLVLGSAGDIAEVRDEGTRMSGAVMSPFAAMLLSRGARTLELRMQRASGTAMLLAGRLERHPAIERVSYPGLPSHPEHELAKRQMERGFGAMIAFEVPSAEAGRRLYDALRVITRAVSLGDTRSLITHPATTSHASQSPAQRAAAGVGEGLLRFSVGIEDPEDLWADLERGLSVAC